MGKKVKTIGILTSGGDAPGMNCAIRAATRAALYKGMRVMGIRRGYAGLMAGDIFEMHVRSVSEIIHRGGTMLYTARSKEFATVEGVDKAREVCVENGIESLITIGGDGTFRGALDLCNVGIPCVGIPGTIDNDIACSDYTIGFDTAMNTAMEMIDKLRDTTQSHSRCSVVEVMGRHAGFLALDVGVACGALTILVPEIEYDIDRDIVNRMLHTQHTGKKHFIIIMAEGCGSSTVLAEEIERITGVVTRATILGHVQRGGAPTTRDRVMASSMGFHAVNLLEKGIGNRVVAYKHGEITDFDIKEGLAMKKTIDRELFEMSQMISV